MTIFSDTETATPDPVVEESGGIVSVIRVIKERDRLLGRPKILRERVLVVVASSPVFASGILK